MRYGLLADIHANLDALRAAVVVLRREGVDACLCAGDLVGYGPFPNECVEVVADLGAACVAGNHDLMALGLLPDTNCIALARETMKWTRSVLRDDTRRYLETLPLRLQPEPSTVIAHGSLDDPQSYIVRSRQAIEALDRLGTLYPAADILVLGHTHAAAVVGRQTGAHTARGAVSLAASERYLLNPGSIGQSREREAVARFAVLDLEQRSATFFAIPYDLDRCRRALRQRGLPADACHLQPHRLRFPSTALGSFARAAVRALPRRRPRS